MIRRALGGVRRALHRTAQYLRPPLPRGHYTLFSARPPLLLVPDFALHHPRAGFLRLLHRLRRDRPHVYYFTSWHVRPDLVSQHLGRLRQIEHACPGVGTTVMAQTLAETDRFLSHGVDALFCNQNALADERVFRPLPGIARRYDAIYDATPAPYKRHALAARIPALACIGYLNTETGDAAVAAEVVRSLGTAHWFNDPLRAIGDAWLSSEEVNRAYNACRVGLCLSAVEGAMWASIQYLLAGLPVVSTPSEGGRAEFFAPPHVEIAEPSPEAVADAVARLARGRLDPWAIREATLGLMASHRARFVAHVQARLDAAGESRRFADEWRQVIPHRLTDMTLVGPAKRQAIAAHDRAILHAVRAARRGGP